MQKRFIRLAVLLALPTAFFVLYRSGVGAADVAQWLGSMGNWAPVAFVLLYALATVAMIPATFLTLLAGALFGTWWGTAFVMMGATTGAILAFLVGRYLAQDWVRGKLQRAPALGRLDAAFRREGTRIAVLVRFCPLFPFFLANYAFALTSIRLRSYILSLVALLPSMLSLVHTGAVASAAVGGGSLGILPFLTAFLGLAAGVAIGALAARLVRRSLGGEEGASAGALAEEAAAERDPDEVRLASIPAR